MGVVGIRIHGLRDREGRVSEKGPNPFRIGANTHEDLSRVVKCYDPPGRTSLERYEWIRQNLAGAVEEAIEIRVAQRVVKALRHSAELSRDIDHLFQMLELPNEHRACIAKIGTYGTFDLSQIEDLLDVARQADPKILRIPEIHKAWSKVVDTMRNIKQHHEDKSAIRFAVNELDKILHDSLI